MTERIYNTPLAQSIRLIGDWEHLLRSCRDRTRLNRVRIVDM